MTDEGQTGLADFGPDPSDKDRQWGWKVGCTTDHCSGRSGLVSFGPNSTRSNDTVAGGTTRTRSDPDRPTRAYPRDWSDRRMRAKERDGYQCQHCGRSESEVDELHAHHCVPLENGGNNRVSNLQTLCDQCHKAAHGEVLPPRKYFRASGDLSTERFEDLLGAVRNHSAFHFDPERGLYYLPRGNENQLPYVLRRRLRRSLVPAEDCC